MGRAFAGFNDHQQAITAGHLAFLGLVSLFPFLIVLVSLAALIGSTDVAGDALDAALRNVPADVAGALRPVADQILNAPRAGTVTLGLVSALWAASSGLEALRYAFNRAYHVGQPRQLWWRRLQSLAFTLVFAAAVIVSTLSVVVMPIVVDALAYVLDEPSIRHTGGALLSRVGGVLALVLATAAVYKVLPRPRIRWREALPGALLAVVAWFAIANVFGFYLSEVASLSLTYGSLGGVVASLLFFYVTACVVLFGCEFNAAEPRRQPHQRA